MVQLVTTGDRIEQRAKFHFCRCSETLNINFSWLKRRAASAEFKLWRFYNDCVAQRLRPARVSCHIGHCENCLLRFWLAFRTVYWQVSWGLNRETGVNCLWKPSSQFHFFRSLRYLCNLHRSIAIWYPCWQCLVKLRSSIRTSIVNLWSVVKSDLRVNMRLITELWWAWLFRRNSINVPLDWSVTKVVAVVRHSDFYFLVNKTLLPGNLLSLRCNNPSQFYWIASLLVFLVTILVNAVRFWTC